MTTFLNIWKNSTIKSYLILQARFKSKTHWAKLKKKNGPKYKALNHFDEFYGSVFGNKWEPMREALLRRSKYVAVINNFGDTEETMNYLLNRGAHCLENLMSVQSNFHDEYSPNSSIEQNEGVATSNIDNFLSRLQSEEISNIYPQGNETPVKIEINEGISIKGEQSGDDVTFGTLSEASDEACIDETRIINPGMGVSSESLYQYVPATKLKGMEEWIPESSHFTFYANNKSGDFPLVIEPEMAFTFPEHLKVMTYEKGSEERRFPEPKRGKTGMFNYYPMDLGSVLAVLALGLRAGDRVLDLCAAPGGKSLVALQTLLPDLLICNDVSISRSNRMDRIFRDYLMDYSTGHKWHERLLITHKDGCFLTDDCGFDKVLVDVPCTTDRHSVMEDENNVFRPDRARERLRIPELQAQLLGNALRLVRVGGAVVYSTCSLSPAQNDGVVHAALKVAFQEHAVLASVRDLSSSFRCLSSTLSLGSGLARPKYGQLVTPDVDANFGPSYVARLVRVK